MQYLFNNYFLKLHDKLEEIAVISEENGFFKKITFKQLHEFCYSLQIKIGLAEKEERIAILIDNQNEFVIAFLTAIYSGYSVVAINRAAGMEEKNKIIKENSIKKLLTISDNKEIYVDTDVIYVDIINRVSGEIKQVETANICIVSYTSGTSGKFSKGVKLTYDNIFCTVNNYQKIYRMQPEDNMLIALSLWHNYGMIAGLCTALHVGCRILIMKKWNFESFKKMVSDYHASIFPGSPYMYIDIVENFKQSDELSSLRVCDSGGDTLAIECIKRFEHVTGAIITEGYGLTETSSLTHFNFSAKERKVGSIGKCVDGVSCKIMDLDKNEINQNEWGLLYIKGKMVFCGYINNDDTSAIQNGWFNTNDIAKVDSEGYYYIAGRYSDIKSIDATVYNNRRIENDIYKNQMVERVFVKRKRIDDLKIDCYKIYVKLKKECDDKEIQQFIKENVNYVVVDEVIIVDNFILTDTGKIKRNSDVRKR